MAGGDGRCSDHGLYPGPHKSTACFDVEKNQAAVKRMGAAIFGGLDP